MSRQPNILFITTDQQRYDTIHAAGYEFISTPHIDRIAKEGCIYPNAYSPNPVCIPARHNMLTGLPARYHGFDDNYFVETRNIPFDLPTFPQILSDSGYDTIAIGKMHFQPYRRHNGFHKLHLMDEIPRYREDDEYAIYLKENGYEHLQSVHGVRHLLYMLPQRSMVDIKHHGSSWVADKTIEYLDENRGKRPFVIWSGFIHPHPPFDVPTEWADMYKGKDIPEPFETVTPLSAIAEENKHIADYPTKDYLRRARELYYASISFVDYNIGRILEKLEEIGELDNTLIIFTSDHGEALGDYDTYQKFLPYDCSSRIPFIMRYPERIQADTVDERMVDLNDLLPTMLDVAGVDYPGNIELPGESILIKDGKKDRTLQYVEHCKGNRRWISLRENTYKYNYYYGGGYEELFDLANDPQETTNLLHTAPTKEVVAIKESIRKKLIAIEKEQGLEGYVENDDFICLPPYEVKPYRETNFPIFPSEIRKPEEKEKLISITDEVLLAIKDEPVVKLEELDLETFKVFGKLSDKEIEDLLERTNKH